MDLTTFVMPYYGWVALAALFGIVTHVAKRLRDEQVASGVTMNLEMLKAFVVNYFVGHLLELIVMLLLVVGSLFLLAQLGELTLYNAYLTGIAGNALSDATGRRAKDMLDRTSGPPPKP